MTNNKNELFINKKNFFIETNFICQIIQGWQEEFKTLKEGTAVLVLLPKDKKLFVVERVKEVSNKEIIINLKHQHDGNEEFNIRLIKKSEKQESLAISG